MYLSTRISLLIHSEYAEEADMSLSRHCRSVGGIGRVVTACALVVVSACGGNGGDDRLDTNTNGDTSTTDTEGTTEATTGTTDDTTTLTRPSTTTTTIENSP
jgi:hypothetical protein